ncbi:hypothetical protein DFJ73DRAFT_783283 [Zopfochytrium polystomum]|nr:hypothetical protein DFJ73DRAFT_783283 [Zopfochytrium polystomum]
MRCTTVILALTGVAIGLLAHPTTPGVLARTIPEANLRGDSADVDWDKAPIFR